MSLNTSFSHRSISYRFPTCCNNRTLAKQRTSLFEYSFPGSFPNVRWKLRFSTWAASTVNSPGNGELARKNTMATTIFAIMRKQVQGVIVHCCGSFLPRYFKNRSIQTLSIKATSLPRTSHPHPQDRRQLSVRLQKPVSPISDQLIHLW